MRYQLKMCLLVILSLCAAGCIDTKQEFFLNPDGSGKVIHETSLQSLNITIGIQESAESKQKKMVKAEIEKSIGIETWKDVSFEPVGDDQVKFKGTAYFKDVNKLKIHNGGASISFVGHIDYQIKGDEIFLELKNKEEKKKSQEDGPVNYTEEELAAKIEENKREYQKTRVMLAGVLPSLRHERIFHLPGKVESMHNFTRRDDGALVNIVEGTKMLEAMDKLMEDEELIARQIKSGRNVMKDGFGNEYQSNEIFFEENAPVQATLWDARTPLFDYASEVEEAKQNYAKVSALLDLPKKVTVRPSDIGEFKVVGVRLITFSDQDNGIRPFNFDEGYTLSIMGALPEKVLKATEGKVISAIADNGTNLLSEKGWDRKINFITLGEDQQTVIFDVNLKLPSKDVKGLKEVSGDIVFVTSQGFKEVDLQLSQFTTGAKGGEFDAEIVKIGEDQWTPGKQSIELKLSLAKYKIKDIEFFDSSNQKLVVESAGSSTWEDSSTLNYRLKDGEAFPASGKVVIHVYENLQNFEMPFILSDISLLGETK